MSIRIPPLRAGAALIAGFCLAAVPVFAQSAVSVVAQSEPDHSQHEQPHAHGSHGPVTGTREGSGTSWLPDETPIYAAHRQAGAWMLMAHGNAFLQSIWEGGDRGGDQFGSLSWVMGAAERQAAGGRLRMRGMVSLEPWTVPGCGYPDLLASGERCEGQTLHDRQHPHDLFMELAGIYDRSITRRVALQVYGAPVGEPALGPVAFPHRPSAMPNPLAPITHHWFDATHISFGVITAGAYGQSWKAETSLFNGREPDERRTDFDFGALDSWSGRLWFLPANRWALQVSAGRLKGAEPAHDGNPETDLTRVTASVTYHRMAGGRVTATTIGWAQNREAAPGSTNALLAEGSLTIDDRDALFGRLEFSEKTGHDLAIDADGIFHLTKIQAGYTRYLRTWGGLKPGFGASVSSSIVPERLTADYGGRVNVGLAVFLTLRPAERAVAAPAVAAAPGNGRR